jgi:predicted NAD-dependent protein-ADP-ribosyltransferase YbiA (DUF1768 family)
MKVLLKRQTLVLVPETEADRASLDEWKTARTGHVFHVHTHTGEAMVLGDLCPREDACNEPINISSTCAHPAGRLISNFAPTPFALDGREYACVEAFWQGLKFANESERRGVASLDGPAARKAGEEQGYGATVTYEGREIVVGTWEHWQLMEAACVAKFTQHDEAQAALLSTGERPLQHRMRRDSRAIPGAIMAEIWMRIRAMVRSRPSPG